MKRDCSLFSRMYISCQNRDGDLDEFFRGLEPGLPAVIIRSGKFTPSKEEVRADGMSSSAHCATKSDAQKFKRRHYRWGSSG